MLQASENLVRYVENLSGEKTPLADFSDILLDPSRSSKRRKEPAIRLNRRPHGL